MRTVTIAASVAVVAALAGSGIALAVTREPARDPGRAITDEPCARQYVRREPRPLGKDTLLLERIDGAGSTNPAALAVLPGTDDGVLGDRTGRVARIEDGVPTSEVVLDFTGETQEEGDGGLLGLAYDPEGEWLYVYRADADMDDVVLAYPVDADGRPDEAGGRQILFVDHPPSNQHHGGGFAFGPDGNLWIGMGDGGGLGDPRNTGQNTEALLGKLLRITPTPEAQEPYAVPADNPFVGRDGYRPEIWAYGLRNPFRLSFDSETGDLWVGDVGQSCWEELDLLPADEGWLPGANLGWDRREGTFPFEGGPVAGRVLDPVHVYAHRDGWCAIAAGYVVRDGALPGLDGYLLHADYCKGQLYALRPGGDGATGQPPDVIDTGVHVDRSIAVFAGPDGLPWILSLDGPIYRVRPARSA